MQPDPPQSEPRRKPLSGIARVAIVVVILVIAATVIALVISRDDSAPTTTRGGLQLIELAVDAAEYLFWVLLLVGIPAVLIAGLFALAVRVVRRSWPKLLTLVIVGLVVALALGSPLLFARGRHLVQLYQLEEVVCRNAPPGAEVVSCGGRVGLESNGNHCDWTVEVSLRGPVDRLHYETMPAPSIVSDYRR
jgi:hypothetical protein